MKKKFALLTIALVLVCAFCLVACNGYAQALKDIQKLLKVDYSEIVLNVTTTTQGYTLNGNYTFTFEKGKTIVDYEYDKLNELDVNGDNADSYLTRVTGRAEIVDGKIVGSDVTLSFDIDFNGISFKEAFFENYSVSETVFEADVANPKGFTGNNDLVCSNMRVKVLYSKSALNIIQITYVSQKGAEISLSYSFTK